MSIPESAAVATVAHIPTGDTTEREYTYDESAMIKEIRNRYRDATNWRFEKIGLEFIDGNTYTVWFTTKDVPDINNAWFYAYVDKSGCRLFDDGDQTVAFMQGILEQRRNFWQRIKDFDFLDIIGACIALPIIFAFVYIIMTAKGTADAIGNEFLTIVSLILGYYFGRNNQK